MKRIILLLTLIGFVGAATTIGVMIHNYQNREQIFYDQAFKQLNDGKRSRPMITIDFDTGDSASVILEHACCSGAGFDAVAIRTSGGLEFIANKNYCGLEGFYSDLEPDATKNIGTFTSFLERRGYRKR
jgi:hypothetical protein